MGSGLLWLGSGRFYPTPPQKSKRDFFRDKLFKVYIFLLNFI